MMKQIKMRQKIPATQSRKAGGVVGRGSGVAGEAKSPTAAQGTANPSQPSTSRTTPNLLLNSTKNPNNNPSNQNTNLIDTSPTNVGLASSQVKSSNQGPLMGDVPRRRSTVRPNNIGLDVPTNNGNNKSSEVGIELGQKDSSKGDSLKRQSKFRVSFTGLGRGLQLNYNNNRNSTEKQMNSVDDSKSFLINGIKKRHGDGSISFLKEERKKWLKNYLMQSVRALDPVTKKMGLKPPMRVYKDRFLERLIFEDLLGIRLQRCVFLIAFVLMICGVLLLAHPIDRLVPIHNHLLQRFKYNEEQVTTKDLIQKIKEIGNDLRLYQPYDEGNRRIFSNSKKTFFSFPAQFPPQKVVPRKQQPISYHTLSITGWFRRETTSFNRLITKLNFIPPDHHDSNLPCWSLSLSDGFRLGMIGNKFNQTEYEATYPKRLFDTTNVLPWSATQVASMALHSWVYFAVAISTNDIDTAPLRYAAGETSVSLARAGKWMMAINDVITEGSFTAWDNPMIDCETGWTKLGDTNPGQIVNLRIYDTMLSKRDISSEYEWSEPASEILSSSGDQFGVETSSKHQGPYLTVGDDITEVGVDPSDKTNIQKLLQEPYRNQFNQFDAPFTDYLLMAPPLVSQTRGSQVPCNQYLVHSAKELAEMDAEIGKDKCGVDNNGFPNVPCRGEVDSATNFVAGSNQLFTSHLHATSAALNTQSKWAQSYLHARDTMHLCVDKTKADTKPYFEVEAREWLHPNSFVEFLDIMEIETIVRKGKTYFTDAWLDMFSTRIDMTILLIKPQERIFTMLICEWRMDNTNIIKEVYDSCTQYSHRQMLHQEQAQMLVLTLGCVVCLLYDLYILVRKMGHVSNRRKFWQSSYAKTMQDQHKLVFNVEKSILVGATTQDGFARNITSFFKGQMQRFKRKNKDSGSATQKMTDSQKMKKGEESEAQELPHIDEQLAATDEQVGEQQQGEGEHELTRADIDDLQSQFLAEDQGVDQPPAKQQVEQPQQIGQPAVEQQAGWAQQHYEPHAQREPNAQNAQYEAYEQAGWTWDEHSGWLQSGQQQRVWEGPHARSGKHQWGKYTKLVRQHAQPNEKVRRQSRSSRTRDLDATGRHGSVKRHLVDDLRHDDFHDDDFHDDDLHEGQHESNLNDVESESPFSSKKMTSELYLDPDKSSPKLPGLVSDDGKENNKEFGARIGESIGVEKSKPQREDEAADLLVDHEIQTSRRKAAEFDQQLRKAYPILEKMDMFDMVYDVLGIIFMCWHFDFFYARDIEYEGGIWDRYLKPCLAVEWWDDSSNAKSLRDTFEQYTDAILQLVERLMLARNISTAGSVLVVFAAMRIITLMRGHPRIALLYETLYLAIDDVWHFMLGFGFLYATLGFTAYMQFGPTQTEYYGSFFASCYTQLQMVIGEYPFEDFSITPKGYIVYVLFFIIIVVYILLNLFFAIIIESFAQVKTSIATCVVEKSLLADAALAFIIHPFIYYTMDMPSRNELILRFLFWDDEVDVEGIYTEKDAIIDREALLQQGIVSTEEDGEFLLHYYNLCVPEISEEDDEEGHVALSHKRAMNSLVKLTEVFSATTTVNQEASYGYGDDDEREDEGEEDGEERNDRGEEEDSEKEDSSPYTTSGSDIALDAALTSPVVDREADVPVNQAVDAAPIPKSKDKSAWKGVHKRVQDLMIDKKKKVGAITTGDLQEMIKDSEARMLKDFTDVLQGFKEEITTMIGAGKNGTALQRINAELGGGVGAPALLGVEGARRVGRGDSLQNAHASPKQVPLKRKDVEKSATQSSSIELKAFTGSSDSASDRRDLRIKKKESMSRDLNNGGNSPVILPLQSIGDSDTMHFIVAGKVPGGKGKPGSQSTSTDDELHVSRSASSGSSTMANIVNQVAGGLAGGVKTGPTNDDIISPAYLQSLIVMPEKMKVKAIKAPPRPKDRPISPERMPGLQEINTSIKKDIEAEGKAKRERITCGEIHPGEEVEEKEGKRRQKTLMKSQQSPKSTMAQKQQNEAVITLDTTTRDTHPNDSDTMDERLDLLTDSSGRKE